MTQNIDEILESVLTKTSLKTPKDIANAALNEIEEANRAEILMLTFDRYVSWWLMQRRRRIDLPEAEDTPESFAPDDLLSDEGQEIQRVNKTKMAIARGSSRVDAIRAEWRRHFLDRFWNGTAYIKYGDATADDLRGAADALRKQAGALNGKADYYVRLADAIGSKKVSDFDRDPTV